MISLLYLWHTGKYNRCMLSDFLTEVGLKKEEYWMHPELGVSLRVFINCRNGISFKKIYGCKIYLETHCTANLIILQHFIVNLLLSHLYLFEWSNKTSYWMLMLFSQSFILRLEYDDKFYRFSQNLRITRCKRILFSSFYSLSCEQNHFGYPLRSWTSNSATLVNLDPFKIG